ncbi:MAG: hypothetical protein WA948_12660 [Pontixanthobacter sp.]
MADLVLVDSDVILKLFAYREANFITSTMPGAPAAMLSIARFVIRKRSGDYISEAENPEPLAALEALFAALVQIEPTSDEIELAAELEETAIRKGFDLDVGEAQLLAILIRREAVFLLTGDKRAVIAINQCMPEPARHRIVCLEQIMATIVRTTDHNDLRRRICAKPNVDRAMTACFSCSTPDVQPDDILAGLRSYCGDLRQKSGDCLIVADDMAS